jgi:cell division septum initiation protein DivIVA
LLPSDVGRTTMCPTEIFHDPSEEPYLKLLSVETRYRDESIAYLRNNPVEWSKIRLNINDPEAMRKALAALTDTKRVYVQDARMMGMVQQADESGKLLDDEDVVEVPAWRYAIINYPHPLLTAGLTVLDTPGLNALGLEPELTISTIPSAQAVLFLLGIDTGVTKSDLDIWKRHVNVPQTAKVAVLNKIDLMWDEIKREPEIKAAIERMVAGTCKHLNLPPERVFALSAQKALVGRIKGDEAVVARSGIAALEHYLANDVLPIKRQLLARAVAHEIGAMMKNSHQSCQQNLQAVTAQLAELGQLSGKSRDLVNKLWQQVKVEKDAYDQALREYKTQRTTFNTKRNALMDRFHPGKIDDICERSLKAINDSWNTVGLTRGMRELIRSINANFGGCAQAGEEIWLLMEGVYRTFHERFKFEQMEMPPLDFEGPRNKLKLLVYETENFCKDPVNIVMTEKRFLVRRFWRMLVEESRNIMSEARSVTDTWLQTVPLPLETRIKDHKTQLDARLATLASINNEGGAIKDEVAKLKVQQQELEAHLALIRGLVDKMRDVGKATTPVA